MQANRVTDIAPILRPCSWLPHTVTAMFTGFQVNLYADDVEPGVAFYAAMGFDETCQYSPAGGRCTSSSRTAG